MKLDAVIVKNCMWTGQTDRKTDTDSNTNAKFFIQIWNQIVMSGPTLKVIFHLCCYNLVDLCNFDVVQSAMFPS